MDGGWEGALKAKGRDLGLDLVGIAHAGPFLAEARLLRERAQEGLRSRFEAEEIALRTEPGRLLPGVRSIVAAAVAYGPGRDIPHGGRSETGGAGDRRHRGRLSRYAWGEDYHRVLHRRLQALADWLAEAHPEPFAYRICVDTAPALDRAIAHRAGLGWYGKNCCLITPRFGSWVFLGSLFTTLPLQPDGPLEEGCGDCRRCLDACPTGALAPYRLDPERCLAEWSQRPGLVPLELRRPMGRRLWGCDTCQEVCPYNRGAEGARDGTFTPEPDAARPVLEEILAMTKGRFRERFGRTAAAWRGKRTLARNALTVLGNLRDPSSLPTLRRVLGGSHAADLRGMAAWAIGETLAEGGDRLEAEERRASIAALRRAVVAEPDEGVRGEIASALRAATSSSKP